ncbi:MAG: response regulator transcription factor [Actinobacteria bacterium]|nr:response regulator transcription factor [Actinomycetota bacterium]
MREPAGQMSEVVRIAIADDSEVVRNLIEEIARFEPDYELVASFDNGRDIAAWVREGGRADVFVIDMRLPGLSGTATISALRRRLAEARILAFSASAQEESVKAALAAGADGYLLKESTLSELLNAIRADDNHGGSDGLAGVAPLAKPAETDARGSGLSVLVIDDHDLVRDATTALLESKRFRVYSCASADEAREWLAGGNLCDAALVDVRLGGESGAEMVSEFRAITPTTAVLLHSGATDTDGARLVRETGADGFLAKGDYTIDEMVSGLTAAIDRRRESQGL